MLSDLHYFPLNFTLLGELLLQLLLALLYCLLDAGLSLLLKLNAVLKARHLLLQLLITELLSPQGFGCKLRQGFIILLDVCELLEVVNAGLHKFLKLS